MEQHTTDILIIGAGLTGLTTAFHLVRGGKRYIYWNVATVLAGRSIPSVKRVLSLRADRIPV